MSTLERLKALLENASNLNAIARVAGCHARTLYRIRDGHMDPTTKMADAIAAAARKFQRRRVR